jgi:4-amino-4-deoxy-L-arabinose transferase-like glycosyltransferase
MMNRILSSQTFWMVSCFILLFPALLVNLGINPFIEDEAIRGTVAMEMMYSGNYITPTINGVYYYYKPPLYNWILVFFYQLFGISEWSSRIVTVFFLFGFGNSIYLIHRKVGFNTTFSILAALIYITCGRVMFWDSFLGLIDIFYSWMMYLLMVYIYLDWKAENWWMLYLRSFALVTIGFMLKGYPTFLFLGCTLAVMAFMTGRWKKLFHPATGIGMLLSASVIGGYYYLYSQYHDVSNTFMPLLQQATSRTGIWHGIGQVILHIFTYPFENVYHFLPWSLMAILLIRKGIISRLKSRDFVWFCMWAFIANIIVYWVSPQVYPRYILMLVPLIFTVMLYVYQELPLTDLRKKLLHGLWGLILVGAPIFLIVGVNSRDMSLIPALEVKVTLFFIGLLGCAIAFLLTKQHRLFIVVATVLIIRIVFNYLVMPIRTSENIASRTSYQAIEVARKYGEEGISMYKKSVIDFTSTFYMDRELGYILDRTSDTPYKIIDQRLYTIPEGYEVVDTFLIRRDERILNVIRKDN